MRKLIFLTAFCLMMAGLFIGGRADADESCLPGRDNKVCEGSYCTMVGQTLLDYDGRHIIACLYEDSELKWQKVNDDASIVQVSPYAKYQVDIALTDTGLTCSDPTVMGGFKACNHACFLLCNQDKNGFIGGVLSQWAGGALTCTCYRGKMVEPPLASAVK